MSAEPPKPEPSASDWRPWDALLGAVPPLAGALVLDLGCGAGEASAELAARGARVIGVDTDEARLRRARAREIPGATFRAGNLRTVSVEQPVDGIWCSFTAAYLTDLATPLAVWKALVKPDGWIALTEVDDLLRHEPVQPRTRRLLDAYASDALAAHRYDFQMGRKLGAHLERAGWSVAKALSLRDRELSFDGPAEPAVLEAWRLRLARLQPLHAFCGDEWPAVQADLLACLAHPAHRSIGSVRFVLARPRPAPAA